MTHRRASVLLHRISIVVVHGGCLVAKLSLESVETREARHAAFLDSTVEQLHRQVRKSRLLVPMVMVMNFPVTAITVDVHPMASVSATKTQWTFSRYLELALVDIVPAEFNVLSEVTQLRLLPQSTELPELSIEKS